MSYRCPVCKARLWQGPFFRRVHCPRCGAEFRPTVPWSYFQVLVLLIVVLGLSLVLLLTGNNFWLMALFLIVAGLFLWFLPRLIDLEPVARDLGVAGPVTNEEIQLELNYRNWVKDEEPTEPRFALLYLVGLSLLLFLLVWALFRAFG